MRCEVVAVGTELLLGQIIDTNSSWIGEHLALAGIDSHYQTKVGDNLDRIVEVLRLALTRSDAVIVCGGLGPTQDDITRQAIAKVMGVELRRDPMLVERIRAMFAARRRPMPDSNLSQADLPEGATPIEQTRGTAPGLICPVRVGDGDSAVVRPIYAVPGVPHEMRDMIERAVIPDLQRRAGQASVIVSRTLRTWGESESGLAERLADEIEMLDLSPTATLAFLASGIEGLKIRITAKASTHDEAVAAVSSEEHELRRRLGDLVFGVDDETMEYAVAQLLIASGQTLAVAESVTGGLIGARLTNTSGISKVFRGGVISYQSQVKFDLLGVPDGPVVTPEAARAMAAGVRRLLDADIGLATTGVAGPDPQDDMPPGVVFVGLAFGEASDAVEVRELRLPGDRHLVRQYAVISALDLLRHRLLAARRGTAPEDPPSIFWMGKPSAST